MADVSLELGALVGFFRGQSVYSRRMLTKQNPNARPIFVGRNPTSDPDQPRHLDWMAISDSKSYRNF